MKPILFNTEMVRAILEGRKTVTRRVAKKVPTNTHRVEPIESGQFECYYGDYLPEVKGFFDGSTIVTPPYQVNDILYVRETWRELITPVGAAKDYSYKADIHNAMMSVFNGLWRPSIHMPKEAARLFLRVTDVRVERLQDMKPEDALKEGVKETFPPLAVDEFRDIWNSTLGRKHTPEYYSNCWSNNPYVWVIEFEVIPKEVATEGLENG